MAVPSLAAKTTLEPYFEGSRIDIITIHSGSAISDSGMHNGWYDLGDLVLMGIDYPVGVSGYGFIIQGCKENDTTRYSTMKLNTGPARIWAFDTIADPTSAPYGSQSTLPALTGGKRWIRIVTVNQDMSLAIQSANREFLISARRISG
jgi:hypothetical protein